MWFSCGDISSLQGIWVEESLAGDDSAGYADFAVVTETVTNSRYSTIASASSVQKFATILDGGWAQRQCKCRGSWLQKGSLSAMGASDFGLGMACDWN
jgi:hypothetical protein